MAAVTCSRCGQTREAPSSVPYSGSLGEEILAKACAACWSDWLQTEVIVINELRLDFMDPRAQDILVRNMREFLGLDGNPPVTR